MGTVAVDLPNKKSELILRYIEGNIVEQAKQVPAL